MSTEKFVKFSITGNTLVDRSSATQFLAVGYDLAPPSGKIAYVFGTSLGLTPKQLAVSGLGKPLVLDELPTDPTEIAKNAFLLINAQ